MKHPFDDFIPPAWHKERADTRVVRIGVLLVAIVSVATATAFAATLSGWRSVLTNRESVTARWVDASERVQAYVKVQKDIQDAMLNKETLQQLSANVPRSLLLWEVTQSLPEQTRLDDIRLETRKRMSEDEETVTTESITLLGVASNDASISSYIDALSSCEYFSKVSLLYAQLDKHSVQRIFSVKLEIGNPKIFMAEASE
jgi:Tfp pilus assembly protein PilN